jgi:hypothetical protein
MAYRNYSVANGFTVATDGSGDFTTIAAALTAASSGKDIFIRPGTYTENLTLKAGVNLVGFTGDSEVPNVSIVGKCSYSVSGIVCISNIRLVTNSNFLLEVTGSVGSVVKLNNCRLACSNNTGINYTSSGAGSQIQLFNCQYAIAAGAFTLFTSSAAGEILISGGSLANGGSTTASTASSGSVTLQYTVFTLPLSVSGSATLQTTYSILLPGNTTAITTSGTSIAIVRGCRIGSGTASALSIGSGTSLSCFSTSLGSSNTNAVAGAGNFTYAGISFDNTSNTLQNTLTLQLLGVDPANAASGALLASTGTNTSPAYTLTPSVTSITLGGGTALANYIEGTFTPTLIGQTTAGTTTYTTQNGYYTRIGNLVTCIALIQITAATGTGNVTLAGLPFTVKNQSGGATTGSIIFSGVWAWPGTTTSLNCIAQINTTTALIQGTGSLQNTSNMQMTNAAAIVRYTLTYQI